MSLSSNQFGLLVAYLLPGFIGLAGIAPFVPTVTTWLKPLSQAEASLGPPIYAMLAATTIGMILNCARWLFIDHIHHWTGVTPPIWDDSHLEERLHAFDYLVQNHFRFHQFVANTLVALTLAYPINRWMGTLPIWGIGTDFGFLILCVTLFAGSRDALSKYYTRTSRLVGLVTEKGSEGRTMHMHNGNDHRAQATPGVDSTPATKLERKAQPPPKPRQTKTKAIQFPK